jgi:predicted GH43/DUF377 family glycosyl hydrolase
MKDSPVMQKPVISLRYRDTDRLGRPFAKDPSVIRFQERYWLYYSIPPYAPGRAPVGVLDGWSVGIAQSQNLVDWVKVGELLPQHGHADQTGLAAPGARVIGDKVHLFYQSYGQWERDAICHAVSEDGIHFARNPANPVFRPQGCWNSGRAIDAEVFVHNDCLLLYYATRDPEMKVQMLGAASADIHSDFGPSSWTDLSLDGPMLRPELDWEKDCIEAPTVCRHGHRLYLFYGGGYNNAPQQIGVACSNDGIHWRRLSDQPFLPNGGPGTWNSSESGHPGVFVDDDGSAFLFYQGNSDNGHTWLLACTPLFWETDGPKLSSPRVEETRGLRDEIRT